MNKRGMDKLISVYWFVILFIVAGAVVYMAVIFYGEPYDVRDVEADIMINQVADCISRGGQIKDEILEDGLVLLTNENIWDKCHLNFNVEEFKDWNNDQYYLEINFYKFDGSSDDSLGESVGKVKAGNSDLKDICNDKRNLFPFCRERIFYTLDGTKQYAIKIKSVVRKTEKNA